MGTSKGYIAPTRIEWKNTKSAVTSWIKETNSENMSKVASRYSEAMKSDGFSNSTMPKAVSELIGLSRNIKRNGISYALNSIGKNNLMNKSNDEIFNELLLYYTNNGATKEDSLALDALSLTMKNLKIVNLEDLGNINEDQFLREILAIFAGLNFEFRFYEKISKVKSPEKTQKALKEMKDYLRGSIYEELSLEKMSEINFGNLAGEQYIKQICNNAFSILEDLYEE
ncbi:hypothetical protein [Clostridium butyricum]|uniref:hypothetical protein n=1 Tax=Clostridium butyricum TaxID=1492 RepID=UPI0012B75123|nr:hypothetical protein [Clostridium butyricum]